MASSLHIIKRGDNNPSLLFDLERSDSSVPNLTGATVSFHYVETTNGITAKAGATVATKACTIVDAAGGTVRVDFTSADTAAAKRFIGEFEVRNGTARETFPNTPNDWVEILMPGDLADAP